MASQEPAARDVIVQTPEAPGAECTLTSPAIGSRTIITPASVNVTGQDILNVSCRKECFQEGSAIVPPDAKEALVAMAPDPNACKAGKGKAKKKK